MKKIFILIVFTVIAVAAFPQRNLTALQYSIGFGTGDMHDYIGKPSFRGFTFDYRNLATSNIGVGVDFGWNVFYEEKADDVYEYQNLTYSGKQWRYSNHFPMLAAADYYLKPDANISGYAGLGYRYHVYACRIQICLPIPLKRMPGILPSDPKLEY